MIKQCKIQKTYSGEFKLMAVKRHIEDGVPYIKVAKEFNIHEQMIIRWCKKYQEFGADSLYESRGRSKTSLCDRPRIKEITKDEEILRLRAENEYLKNLLKLGRM